MCARWSEVWMDGERVYRPQPLRYVGRNPLPPLDADVEEVTSCEGCGDSGFVPCSRCEGSGKIQGEIYVDFCDICVGHGKVRCPVCGGKCYMCA